MLAGIQEILIISTPRDIKFYEELFGNGNDLGLQISYVIQAEPKGLAQAFTIGEAFIGKDTVALVLGDNIFYGRGFSQTLKNAASVKEGAMIFGYYVKNPQDFGVAEFDEDGNVISLEEKPNNRNRIMQSRVFIFMIIR